MLKLIELLKLNQPSTWRGLISLLSGVGVALSPELVEHIIALAVSAFGIVEIVRSEKNGKQNNPLCHIGAGELFYILIKTKIKPCI